MKFSVGQHVEYKNVLDNTWGHGIIIAITPDSLYRVREEDGRVEDFAESDLCAMA